MIELPKIEVPKFDIQQFARDYQDTAFRGRRRISGNWGRLYINGVMIFEISAFEAKITAERDDVWIGQSADSKITGLKGEGSFTIRQVFTRGVNRLMENYQNGYDERFVFIAELKDPDVYQHQVERVRLENVWVNELPIINFEKAAVVDKEFSFGWTPEDTFFQDAIEIPAESVVHETNGGF